MRKHFFLTILLLGFSVSGVLAQWNDNGKLNSWTSVTVSRQNNESRETPYLKEVTVQK